jgi:hypothetical protein
MMPQPPWSDAQESGLRQSALLLHAMPLDDRQWLLENLPAQDRSAITPLLDELASLGIPESPELLQHALAQDTAGAWEVVDASPTDPSSPVLQALNEILPIEGAPAWSRLCVILKEEPAGLVARLLQMHDWSWRAQALRALGPRKRAQVLEHLDLLVPHPPLDMSVSPAAELHSAMLGALFERVLPTQGASLKNEAQGAPPQRPPQSWWKRRWRAVQRMALRAA